MGGLEFAGHTQAEDVPVEGGLNEIGGHRGVGVREGGVPDAGEVILEPGAGQDRPVLAVDGAEGGPVVAGGERTGEIVPQFLLELELQNGRDDGEVVGRQALRAPGIE